MNTILDISILVILTLIIYFKNNQLIHFLNTNLGRFVLIAIIIILSIRNILLGILALVLFYIFRELSNVEEGLEKNTSMNVKDDNIHQPMLVDVNEVPLDGSITVKNVHSSVTTETITKKTTSLKEQDMSEEENNMWRRDNCSQDNMPVFNNKIVPLGDLNKVFKNISFLNDPCNPCDENCKFKVTSSDDKLTTQESIRPISSNILPLSKNRFGNSQQAMTFESPSGVNAGAGFSSSLSPIPNDSNKSSNLVNKSLPNANKLSPAIAPTTMGNIYNMPK